jgi:predicted RNA methylase
MDLQFLRTATRLARRSVYSFHKRSTRQFVLKTIKEEWGYHDAKVVAEMAFDVPNMYKFHTQQSKDIEVDLIRVFVEQDTIETSNDDGAVEKDSGEYQEAEAEDVVD